MTDKELPPHSDFSRQDPLILIADAGEESLYRAGLVSGDEHPGPLLTLLDAQKYDKLVLLTEEDAEARAKTLARNILSTFPTIELETLALSPQSTETLKSGDIYQHVLDSVRENAPHSIIHILLTDERPDQQLAWVRLVYRNENITLLHTDPILHACAEGGRIEVIEESLSPQREHLLRESGEPLIEEIARNLDLVGEHPSFTHMLEKAHSIALFDVPILICGEAGSGKKSLANFIWKTSRRAWLPMRSAKPAGLPDPLEAALLFGSATGSPAGISAGMVSTSNNGTLLVENVEKLSGAVQETLSSFIRTSQYHPVGSRECLSSNVRLIFTSNEDNINGPASLIPPLRDILLPTMLRVPTLRERRDDIPLIALHYLHRINTSLRNHRSLSQDMLKILQKLPWHGNVKELRKAIERAALLSTGGELRLESLGSDNSFSGDLSGSCVQIPEFTETFSLEAYLGDVRRRIILRALEISKGNQSEAARLLHITPQAVHQFLKYNNKKK